MINFWKSQRIYLLGGFILGLLILICIPTSTQASEIFQPSYVGAQAGPQGNGLADPNAPDCTPRIDIRKQANGPDERIFASGSDVPFFIVVTNTGDVDLTNVVVSDPLVPSCSKTIGFLAVGQHLSYSCTAPNVTQGFTNTASVTGTWGSTSVTDEDPSTVKITAIDIRKQEKGPDERVFTSGTNVPFDIVVTNTGEVDLTNVVVSDPLVPSCSKTIGFLAVGQHLSYSCTAPNVTQGFTNIASVTGTVGCISVTDEDPSTVKIAAIDIRKQEKGPDERIFTSGSNVSFDIVVTNTGEVDLSNVVVSDPLVPDCSKTIGFLAAGQHFSYSCTATNVTQGFTNTASVTGTEGDTSVTDEDPSTVKIAGIDIRKQEKGPDERIFASGSNVPFDIVVTNTGEVDLTNVVVSDTLVQDCARVIGNLPAGEKYSYTCTALTVVAGFTNIASVTGMVGDITLTAEDPSTVVITPIRHPAIDIRKQAEGPDSRDITTGSNVLFDIVVKNTGDVDLINITVSDPLVPDCDRTIGLLAPNAEYSYTCTASIVTQSFTNIASVSGVSKEDGQTTVTDEDPSSVRILYPLYFPFISSGPIIKYDISVGFEDLPLAQGNDFDYNDWVVAVNTEFHYTSYINEQTINLTQISFLFTPKARGAALDHQFHVQCNANSFSSNGQATLVIRDGQGNILSTTHFPFFSTQSIDFDIFNSTSVALPPAGSLINTNEGQGPNPAQRTAQLTVTFDNPTPFVLADFGPHGEGLFFQPHLRVETNSSSYDIFVGDIRTIVVPSPDWKWPEERIRIDQAYPDVAFIGPPTYFTFPDGWWLKNNVCIYGDGVACPILNPTQWLKDLGFNP
jgi:uncharacterized repeat protein (TIGR01451 family)